MFESLLDNIPDVIVGKRVINILPRLAIGDKVALAKHFKLMGHRGFCHTEQIRNIANTHGLAVYGEKYADAGGIAQNLEKVREVIEGVLVGHLFPSLINNIAVQLLTFAGGSTLFIKLQLYLPHFALWLNDCSTVYLIITPIYSLVNGLD